ncbi:MAG TPA: DMT family transporter [Longimicrobiaceae bacterium]|nr:DMT family transporter [Longimicrobiaceae bacterium]
MAYLLALLASVFYGSADFLAGLAARRTTTFPVVVLSQVAGLALLVAAVAVLPGAVPRPADFAWGVAGGIASGVGVGLLYHALAIGTMSVVAPVTAVCAVVVPVVAGLAFGERPHPTALAGIALAMAAVVMISQEAPHPGDDGTPGRALPLALVAGAAIGVFYVFLERTGAEAGLWPMLATRLVSVLLFLGGGLVRREPLEPPRRAIPTIVAAGLLDTLANVLYLLAVRQGMLSVVATLASLYPATTVLLARAVLRERLQRIQAAGVACAAVAIVLITAA